MPFPSPSTADPARAVAAPGGHAEAAATALARARDWLLARQDPGGWWQGELETNVTMDAEDLLLREFLGIRTDAETAETAAWIRSRQQADGSWATFAGGPGDLSTTVEAYVALRLAGDDPESAHLRRAAGFVVAHGGLEASRVFTRFWLAMFGEWPWEELPVLPPELILLPRQVPLNVYDFASWARQTIVPLVVVGALRPSRRLPFDLPELRTGGAPPARPASAVGRAFLGLDRVLHRYERRPLKALRRRALARAERWILERQEADGSWGGIQPPWVYSLIALHLLGHPLDSPP